MSKHQIILTVELDDSGDGDKVNVLAAIAEGAVRNAKEDYQRGSDDPEDNPRHDGYDGPFITEAEARVVPSGTFHTPHEQYRERNGYPYTLVRTIEKPDKTHDEEVLPMYEIQFEDGVHIEAWPDELKETRHE